MLMVRIGLVFFLEHRESFDNIIPPAPSSEVTNSSGENPSSLSGLPSGPWTQVTTIITEDNAPLSLQHIMDSVSQDMLVWSWFISTEQLSKLYNENPTYETAVQLVEQLSREFSYDEAYAILKENASLQDSLDPYLVLRILFNSELIASKTRNFVPIQEFIEQLQTKGKINTNEVQRYTSLIDLLQNKKDSFLTVVRSNPTELHPNEAIVISSLRAKISLSEQWRDMPPYYQDGMIALWLFENGYITFSQELSLRLLQSYPQYILPKQILAYTHIVLHERRTAKSYFTELIAVDPDNTSHYQFFVGVSSYWMNNPTDTILYLSQIDESVLYSDAMRYKILSYLQINDYSNASKQLKALLGKADMRNADFILLFEKAIFEPYTKKTDYSILSYDNSLIELYLSRCTSGEFDKDVCMLWEVAQQIYLHKLSGLENTIKPLLEKFPKSYLFVVLADSYLIQWKIEDAKAVLVKALTLADDDTIKTSIRQKLQSLL